jgi:lysophospholipase L1-like esterase
MERVGNQLLLRPEAVGTVWDAAVDGTQITDLLDLTGAPTTTVEADSDGAVAFYGPDGVTTVYVDFDYGRRYALIARDIGEVVTDFIATGAQPGGYATLDGTGKIPAGQIPPAVGDWAKHVAAVSATAEEKARADYVCDGTADDVQIQAAINDVKAAGGGTVVLSSGTFNLAARLLVEGADDVDVEIDIHIRGQGPKSTTLAAGAGLPSAVHLTKVIRAHLSDFGITVFGSSHGISSATTNGVNSGHRSFWDSSFLNLQILGPWDGTHTGWALHLGSPFRSTFQNIEIGGVGNGWRMFSEHADFNPGDCTVTRTFVDSKGDNMVAYEIDSTTSSGVMNQIRFILAEAIADGTGCTGIHLTGVGGWGTAHTHWSDINLEQFDKLVHVEYGSSNTFRLNHVGLRGGATGLTAFTFGANSFNNTIEHGGLLYATDNCKLFADGNTLEPNSPNRILDSRVYGETGVKVTSSVNPAGTTVRKRVVGNTTASTPFGPGIYVPPGWGRFWAAKRDAAAAGSTLARIITVGGSATQGFYASNPRTKSWPGVVASTLQGLYGDGGSGFQQTSLSATILTGSDAAALAAWTTAGAIVTQTGTWTQGGSAYGPGANYLYSDVTGNTLTFKARGTTVKIYTVVGSGTRPNMLYSIDGEADVSVAQPSGTAAIQVTTRTGLSNTEHTVVVKVGTASAGQFLSVCGVSGEKASGVVVHNLALAGASSSRYANPATTALNATWNGGPDFPCDLAIFTAGPNDATANVTGDTWASNVAKWIKAVRDTGSQLGDTDIILATPHLGTHDVSNFKYQDYAERARALADVYNCAVVNWWTLGRNSWAYWNSLGYWGSTAGTGAAGTNSVHMSDAGFAFMANSLLPLLTS